MKAVKLQIAPRGRRGFTLIELLVVLAIISIIVAFAVPAMEPALRGSRLKNAADGLERVMSIAQQVAITDNRPVEFRVYNYDDPENPGTKEHYHSYQAVQVIRDPSDHSRILEEVPVTDVETLPPPFVVSDNIKWSTLVSAAGLTRGTADTPRKDGAEYVKFEFRPDGSTNLTTLDEPFWTLTVLRDSDGDSELPAEFITLILDPYNGQVRDIQP